MNKGLIRTAIIGLIFFGIGAVVAESNLNIFTLRADKVLTDYIGGNTTANKVNITGLIIQAGQVLGYYNESATDALLDAKADQSDLTAHIGNVTGNPHNVTALQVGAAASSHTHSGGDIMSQVNDTDTVDGYHAGNAAGQIPVLDASGKYVGIPKRDASGNVLYSTTELGTNNSVVSSSGAWADTGKDIIVDLTDIDYMKGNYQCKISSNNQPFGIRLERGGTVYSQFTANIGTSYGWYTGAIADVRDLSGSITFNVQISGGSFTGYNQGLHIHPNDYEGVDS